MAPLAAESEPSPQDYREAHGLLKDHRALILLHSNADLDCVGSALALEEAYPRSILAAPKGVSGAGKRLVEGLDHEPLAEELPPDGDEPWELVVVVDSGNPSQVILPDRVQRILVIDHHQPLSGWPDGTRQLCDPDSSSCAELIFKLLEEAGLSPGLAGCQALMVGIVADTAHFRHADAETFLTFARLLQLHDLPTRQVLELMKPDQHRELSRRVAQLKGAQRLRYFRKGQHLIAVARTGAFEAATATALLAIGADVAFVASQKKRRVQLSARCLPRLVEAGLNLGVLLKELAQETGMEGGGHPGAAALMGEGDAEALLNLASGKARRKLPP